MVGIRSFNTNVPHVYRYPEFTEGIFYPAGSVVTLEYIDSDVRYDVYIATKDIDPVLPYRNQNPETWEDWSLIFSTRSAVIDSDLLQALLTLDSDVIKLREDLDSDEEMFSAFVRDNDSDHQHIYDRLDSEYHDRKAADSDLRFGALRHLIDHDSDVLALKSADSDINVRIQRLIDSEIAILFRRTDSDEDQLQWLLTELQRRADSDIKEKLRDDSEIKLMVAEVLHETLGSDSDQDSEILNIRRRLDSDHTAAFREYTWDGTEYDWGPQPYLTNTNYYLDEATITNHTAGHLWLVDHTNGFIYLIRDGVQWGRRVPGNLATTEADFGIAGVHRRGTIIEESPGDDADVTIYQNVPSTLPILTNANLYTVQTRNQSDRAVLVQSRDFEQAFYYTAVTLTQVDSDVAELRRKDSENDSEHRFFYHEIRRLDSDVSILKKDRDSDNLVVQQLQSNIDSERHDWKAGDSDMRFSLLTLFESDIRLSLEHDSELFIKTDSEEKARRNADSDIYNKYTSVTPRWVKTEDTPTNITGAVAVDFNGATVLSAVNGTSMWIWNSYNDRLVIVDSDGSILYNELHNDEPIYVSVGQTQYTRTADSGTNASILESGVPQTTDDIWNFRVEKISSTINDGVYTPFIDSDLNLHEWDSDNTAALVNIIDTIQEEIHNRRAADSDLQIQIWDNDSDIAYLFDVTMKYRGTIDLTADAPYHITVKPGDLYVSMESGLVTNDSDWRNLRNKSINKGDWVLFTDSETWEIVNVSNTADSDGIIGVNRIYDYSTSQNRTLRKLHYARTTDTVFFENDSDVVYVFDAEAFRPNDSVILEGHQSPGFPSTVNMYFRGIGPRTNGTLTYFRPDDTINPVTAIAILTGTINADGSLSVTSALDSEDQRAIVTFTTNVAIGDRIEWRSASGHRSYIKCFDGVNFKKVSQHRIDLDSDIQALKDFDSDVNNGHLGGIDLRYGVVLANVSRADVNANWFLNGGNIGGGGRSAGGIQTRAEGTSIITDVTGQPLSVGVTFETSDDKMRVIIIKDGHIVYSRQHDTGSYINWRRKVYTPEVYDSDGYLYQLNTQIQPTVSGYTYYTVDWINPADITLEFTLDSEYSSLRERNTIITESFESIHAAIYGNKQALSDEARLRSMRDDSEYRARKDADSDLQHGHIGALDLKYSVESADYQAGNLDAVWLTNGANAGLGAGGRGLFGIFDPNLALGTARVTDGAVGTPIAISIGQTYVLNDRTVIAIWYDGKLVYKKEEKTSGTYNPLRRIYVPEVSDSDNNVFAFNRNIKTSGNYSYYTLDLIDRSTLETEFTRDSEYFDNKQKDHIITETFESIHAALYASRTRIDDEIVDRSNRDDSEYVARRDADSDILAQVGRTFVQSTIPNPTGIPLRNGDTWIDPTVNRIYYFDEPTGTWVQLLGTVG